MLPAIDRPTFCKTKLWLVMITLAEVLCTSLKPYKTIKGRVKVRIWNYVTLGLTYISSPFDATCGWASVNMAVEVDVVAGFDAFGVERSSHG